jgi:hypothetical protein
MFSIIKNHGWRRYLWAVVLVGGGLIGLGTMAGQAQAADYSNYTGQQATLVNNYQQPNYVQPNYVQPNYVQTYPTYPYYNSYQYPVVNNYGWGFGYTGFFPWYTPQPNVVYPYVSPYVNR